MAMRFESIRDIMRVLPADGETRHKFRSFNLSSSVNGKARSVREFAMSLGFDVARRSLPGRMTGRLVQDPFASIGYRIDVNQRHSVEAQRFAVLHEIAHFFLHSDPNDFLADDMAFDASGETFYTNDEEEREANSFAAAILFADGALAAAFSLYGGDLKKLRMHFGVSERVIQIGLKTYRSR